MTPLVSIITPITEARRHFLPRLTAMVAAQDYPNIEHVLVWGDGRIGTKRNRGCELAKGSIILHMDSDDLYANNWVSSQVKTLLDSGADACGLKDVYFLNEDGQKAWQYRWNDAMPWVAGATLCYHKSWWKVHPFHDMQTGEDFEFTNQKGIKIAVNDYTDGFIATLHDNNTAKHHKGSRWHAFDIDKLSEIRSNIIPASASSYAPGSY